MKNDDTLYENYTMYDNINNNNNDNDNVTYDYNNTNSECCMFCLSLLTPIIIFGIVFISLRLS
jgi:regulator of replication initiation timing